MPACLSFPPVSGPRSGSHHSRPFSLPIPWPSPSQPELSARAARCGLHLPHPSSVVHAAGGAAEAGQPSEHGAHGGPAEVCAAAGTGEGGLCWCAHLGSLALSRHRHRLQSNLPPGATLPHCQSAGVAKSQAGPMPLRQLTALGRALPASSPCPCPLNPVPRAWAPCDCWRHARALAGGP